MCDRWELLGEVYLAEKTVSFDFDENIYCLCSRVFIKNTETHTAFVAENTSKREDIGGRYYTRQTNLHKKSGSEMHSVEKHDEESVSCYCSASHTDNNYSTDEHDSVRETARLYNLNPLPGKKLSLHQSDSGADLSEYHDQQDAKMYNIFGPYEGFNFKEAIFTKDSKKVNTPWKDHNKYSSDGHIKDTEISHPSSKKDASCTNDSTSFTLGDKELKPRLPDIFNILPQPTTIGEDYSAGLETHCDAPEPFYYKSNKSALDIAWEDFWAKNGEELIWKSWIEKYGEYINPDYFQKNTYPTEKENIEKYYQKFEPRKDHADYYDPFSDLHNLFSTHSNFAGIFSRSNSSSPLKPETVFSSSSSCSLDESSREENNDNDIDSIRKINTDITQDGDNDGWNPLSPFSIEETYNQHSNAEDEKLLMRCDSINGSIAKTNATSDSMTNVTKMTLTSSSNSNSCDFSYSNSTDFSSPSIFESSSNDNNTTDSSSSKGNQLSTEDEKRWQELWQAHFQKQYQEEYKLFVIKYSEKEPIHSTDCNQMDTELSKCANEDPIRNIGNDQSDKQNVVQMDNKTTAQSKVNSIKKINSQYNNKEKRYKEKLIADSVGMLIKKLSMSKSEHNQPVDADDGNTHKSEQTQVQTSVTSTESGKGINAYNDFNFISRRNSSDGEDGDEPPENKSITLKRSHEIDENERGFEKVKRVFSLMGYSFNENCAKTKWRGGVIYRKRNRTKQNRQSKINSIRPNKHIYFDNDGEPIPNPKFQKNKYWSSLDVNESSHTEPLQFTVSSSDEESDSSPIFKLHPLVLNRLSTSSIESQTDVKENAEQCNTDMEIDERYDDNYIKRTQKKKRRKQPFKRNVNVYTSSGNLDSTKLPIEIQNDRKLMKYWLNRYQLFNKFDQGIKLDRESWYSVTPENVAKHIAERCKCEVIVDAFCGAGGNSIQFAFTCVKVIAIDIDPVKIQLARNNARIYGVEDKIEFIVGDFLQLAPKLIADIVFLSPPWGGPEYMKKGRVYDIDNILPPFGGVNLFQLARGITDHVAYYLPKNTDTMQLVLLAGDSENKRVEVEQHLFGSKLIAVTAYYGILPQDYNMIRATTCKLREESGQ